MRIKSDGIIYKVSSFDVTREVDKRICFRIKPEHWEKDELKYQFWDYSHKDIAIKDWYKFAEAVDDFLSNIEAQVLRKGFFDCDFEPGFNDKVVQDFFEMYIKKNSRMSDDNNKTD